MQRSHRQEGAGEGETEEATTTVATLVAVVLLAHEHTGVCAAGARPPAVATSGCGHQQNVATAMQRFAHGSCKTACHPNLAVSETRSRWLFNPPRRSQNV